MHIDRRFGRTLLSVATTVALACFFSAPANAQLSGLQKPVADRVTQTIDETRRMTLTHTVHPLTRASQDLGVLSGDRRLNRIQMVLQRSNAQESALKQLIGDMHTPGSPSYHKWLTPEQFGRQFGPSDADLAKLEAWLASHGFAEVKLNPGRQTLEFSASESQFQEAFRSQIHQYSVKGETRYANTIDPQIPAALAPVVKGFASLNNFAIKSHSITLGKAAYDPNTGRAQPQWTTSAPYGESYVLSPGDFAVQYDLNPLYTSGTDGTGQTIAIINEANIDVSHVNDFRTLFGLPANPPNVIIDGNDPGIDGINNPDEPNGASGEAYLDVEWSGAVAPKATIDLVIAADTALSPGLFLAANRAVYDNIAPVISLSFGECEYNASSGAGQFFQTLWEQAAAQGITVAVSTGDNGSANCDNPDSQDYAVQGLAVSGFAVTPYNVAVGGTDFFYSAYDQGRAAIQAQLAQDWDTTLSNGVATPSIKGVLSEQPWNNSQYGLNILHDTSGETTIAAGSGGASGLGLVTTGTIGPYPKPAFQVGASVADGVRDIPDVSLFAASGFNASFYPVCIGDGDCQPVAAGGTVQIYGIGGTSASAPAFAGMMALVNQKYGRQGQADFVLYPLAAQFPSAFHDVVNGTNSVPCQGGSQDCIPVQNAVTDIDGTLEGQIGTGTTPDYNAVHGYNLATGLGTIDAARLVANWNSITFAASTTTLSPSSTSFSHGTSISLSGTVTGSTTPTGSVVLLNDSPTVSQGGQDVYELAGGAFTGTTNALPGGTYNIWVQYSGDQYNAPGISNKTQITVTPETSRLDFGILSVASEGNGVVNYGSQIPYGTQCVLTAEPLPASKSTDYGSPTGSITFADNGTTLNIANLNGKGEAAYNAAFAVGSHAVSAQYPGDPSFSKSSANPINFTVLKGTPGIGLSSTAETADGTFQGGTGAIVFAIQVVNVANETTEEQTGVYTYSPVAPPTGTVQISGFPAGYPTSVPLQSALDLGSGFPEGVGSINGAGLPAGKYNITISYPGDANYNPVSKSGPITILGSTLLASTTTAVTPSTATSYAAAVKIAATVTGQPGSPAPTGVVTISSSALTLNQLPLTPAGSDVAAANFSLNSQGMLPGQNLLIVQYSGDTVYQPSSATIAIVNGSGPGVASFAVSGTPVAIAAPGASATSSVLVAPSDGFTGTVALTCAVTKPAGATSAPSCEAASAQITGAASAATTLTIDTTAATPGATYTLTLTGTSGNLVASTTFPVVVTAPVAPSFALAGTPITITPPGASGSTAISITPGGAFTGTVALTCTVTGGGATGLPTCALSTPAAITGTSPVTSTLTIGTSTATPDGNYTVIVSGTSGSINQTVAIAVTVSGTAINPSFALSGAAIRSATPGVSAATNITITPAGGFTGTVALACSIASSSPSSQYPPTCTVTSPPSVTGVTPVSATLTFESTAPSTTASARSIKQLFGGGIALACLLLTFPTRQKRLRPLLLVIFAIGGLTVCGAIAGCGSGSSAAPTSPGITGTPAGTYTVTITGTSGSLTETTTVNVTLN